MDVIIEPGNPFPLGAHWDGSGANFALFSANAERVDLCLFDSSGEREINRITLPEHTNQIWHGYVRNIEPGALYGYRVYGPYDPDRGHRFNHHKLLLDPYARAFHGPGNGRLVQSAAHLAYDPSSELGDLSFSQIDSASVMPKCVLCPPAQSTQQPAVPTSLSPTSVRPRVSWPDTVIYETHVRGFTVKHPDIEPALKGTYAGMSQPQVIDHLKSLGITTVELLPVQVFTDERFLQTKRLTNYWGYNSLSFFAPEMRYAHSQHNINGEFREMVDRFHDAGLEVVLDVVYNHTAEGDQLGPTLSFRGIDNASYYRLLPHDPRHYINDTGCGNTLNLNHPRVLQMVMDSLRYWVEVMDVDGFRFDLAPCLAREAHGFDQGSGFLDAIAQDPVLSTVKLIAEPWDIGPSGYQLGQFPCGWAEWNDRFRDDTRRFWMGEKNLLRPMVRNMQGAGELFFQSGRKPWASVNFITAHDGFTLDDLVSYDDKHNEPNGEENRDGHAANHSANHGVEGDTDDPTINALRRRQKRNLLTSLILSQGTPMLLAGDEMSHTQNGNNNAYCQDNDTTWLNWENRADDNNLIHFVSHLIHLRKHNPLLRWPTHLHSEPDAPATINWLNQQAEAISQAQWHDDSVRSFACLLQEDGAPSHEVGHEVGHESACVSDETEGKAKDEMQSETKALVIFLNASEADLVFDIPIVPGVKRWRQMIDTASETVFEMQATIEHPQLNLQARSQIVLVSE